MSNPTIALQPTDATLAGKYLTFALGQESYGVNVLKVREIIRRVDITAVPQMPDFVKGVINLRGKIVPVIDLRVKFGLFNVLASERTCIVVVQVKGQMSDKMQIGLIVDAVEEVANIAASDIDAPPDFGAQLSTEYILGMAKVRQSIKTLLDIDQVVASDALEMLKQTAANR